MGVYVGWFNSIIGSVEWSSPSASYYGGAYKTKGGHPNAATVFVGCFTDGFQGTGNELKRPTVVLGSSMGTISPISTAGQLITAGITNIPIRSPVVRSVRTFDPSTVPGMMAPSTTMLPSERVLLVDPSKAGVDPNDMMKNKFDVRVDLPDNSNGALNGYEFIVKRIDVATDKATNLVVVRALTAGHSVDGAISLSLAAAQSSITVIADFKVFGSSRQWESSSKVRYQMRGFKWLTSAAVAVALGCNAPRTTAEFADAGAPDDARADVDRLPLDVGVAADLKPGPDAAQCSSPDGGPTFVGRINFDCTRYKLDDGTMLEECSVLGRFFVDGVLHSAGTLTVTGGIKPLSLAVTGESLYKLRVKALLWKGGETLTVSASGDVVPPMKASVVVPTQVRFTTPPPGDGAHITVPLKNDFKMAWTGNSSGLLYPSLFTSMVQVGNSVLPALGQGVITATELAKIAPGPGVWLVQQIQFGGASGCDWKLELVATTNPVMSDDTDAHRTATFQ